MSFNIGDRVHYTPRHNSKKENGIVKQAGDNFSFVVFHCGGDWANYKNYTGQHTTNTALAKGWVDANGNILEEDCDHEYRLTAAKWQPINQRTCIWCGKTLDY